MRWWYGFLIVVLVLNSIALGLIYWRLDRLAKQFPFALLESSIKTQNEIAVKLNSIQSLLSATTSKNNPPSVLGMADLLPDKTGSSSPASSFISVAPNVVESVPVYKEQAEFSAILGQLIPDYKYPYFSKTSDWYLVSLSSGKTGWVKAGSVTENP